MAPLGESSFYIGLYREIHLKRPLSKTTELILAKFGWKYLLEMGIKVCANQVAGPFRAQQEAAIGESLGI